MDKLKRAPKTKTLSRDGDFCKKSKNAAESEGRVFVFTLKIEEMRTHTATKLDQN